MMPAIKSYSTDDHEAKKKKKKKNGEMVAVCIFNKRSLTWKTPQSESCSCDSLLSPGVHVGGNIENTMLKLDLAGLCLVSPKNHSV